MIGGSTNGPPRVPRAAGELDVVVRRSATWRVRPDAVADLQAGALDPLLFEAATRRASPGGGRGAILTMNLGGLPAHAKRPVHGGMLGAFLGGLYLGPGRLFEQVRSSARLRERGVPTPEILAVGWRSVFGPVQRRAIVTRTIPGARTLYEALRSVGGIRRRETLACTADLVRKMHDAGFVHADLNLTNLIVSDVEGALRVHVIDLDRGSCRPAVGRCRRTRNLARLFRSQEKWLPRGSALSPREEIRFLRRYSGAGRGVVRRLLKLFRLYTIALGPRRLLWRLRSDNPGRAGGGR